MFNWTKEKESEVLYLKVKMGWTYSSIASHIGTSANSVKHKVRRLQQADGLEKYSHPKEKAQIALPILENLAEVRGNKLKILETHCGFGGMTQIYCKYGSVTGFDIEQTRLNYIQEKIGTEAGLIKLKKCDSESEVFRLCYEKCNFDIIDVDPYGLPSKYFPHVFGLINDGYLFLTFPMLGVAQINALTIKHYRIYWDIGLDDKDKYIDLIIEKLHDYAYMKKRKIEIKNITKINRIYRMVIKVNKIALTKLLGMNISK